MSLFDITRLRTRSVWNRLAVILKVKQPFADWINKQPRTIGRFTLEDLNDPPQIFLFPNHDSKGDNWMQVEHAKPFLFAHMLEIWDKDPATWPQDRSAKVFNEWFSVEISTAITDFDYDEIKTDEED